MVLGQEHNCVFQVGQGLYSFFLLSHEFTLFLFTDSKCLSECSGLLSNIFFRLGNLSAKHTVACCALLNLSNKILVLCISICDCLSFFFLACLTPADHLVIQFLISLCLLFQLCFHLVQQTHDALDW